MLKYKEGGDLWASEGWICLQVNGRITLVINYVFSSLKLLRGNQEGHVMSTLYVERAQYTLGLQKQEFQVSAFHTRFSEELVLNSGQSTTEVCNEKSRLFKVSKEASDLKCMHGQVWLEMCCQTSSFGGDDKGFIIIWSSFHIVDDILK